MLSETELQLLRDSADRLARAVEARGYDLGAAPAAHHPDVAELGWYGLLVAPAQGGFGGSAQALCAVMEALGRGLVRAPYLSSAVLAAPLLAHDGGAPARATLAGLIEGREIVVLADREPGDGHELHRRQTVATPDAGGFRLSGTKTFVADASVATQFLITARLDDRVAVFQVPVSGAGLAVDVRPALDGRAVGVLRLREVVVPAAARLAELTPDRLDAAYDLATLAVCAEACGIVASVTAKTLDYLKTRRQFGVPIGSFQALQHRMADLYVDEQLLRAVTSAAAEHWDAGAATAPIWISAAKLHAGQLGRRIGEGAVQLHGGIGLTEEYVIGHYLKRLLMIAALFGGEHRHLERIGWIDRDDWNA